MKKIIIIYEKLSQNQPKYERFSLSVDIKTQKKIACGGLFRKVILSLLRKFGPGGKIIYTGKSKKKTLLYIHYHHRI